MPLRLYVYISLCVCVMLVDFRGGGDDELCTVFIQLYLFILDG